MFLYKLLLTMVSIVYAYPQNPSGTYSTLSSHEGPSLADGVALFLNNCFKDIDGKIVVIDGRCDALESDLHSARRNLTLPPELLDLKTNVAVELERFSQTLGGFQNKLRQLRSAKEELLRRALRTTTTPVPTTSTTTAEEEDSGSAMQGDGAELVKDYADYTDDTESVAVSCPPGWISITGFSKCYYVSKRNEKANWKSAKKFCSKKGGKLVEIKTDAEAEVLKDAVIPPLSVYHYAYVGRMRKPESNTWVFLTNEEPVDLSIRTWHKPEITTRNDCGCVSRDSDFDMTDCVCSGVKMYFICEK
ncbi:uncharacterized protein [Argopecten irradians]|uniref:uncharacterized protein n=1 Tax=Argopecten irradians TaxID=31199 RepID=UPI003716A781